MTLFEELAVVAVDLLHDRLQMVVVLMMMMMKKKVQGWGMYTVPLNQLEESIKKDD